MAIIGPADLPSIIKLRSEPMKKYIMTKLGFGSVQVELSEDQLETVFRVSGDFISRYFPREQKLAVFYTEALKPTYPLPKDAYWIQEVQWDPFIPRIDDIFGAQSYIFNQAATSGASGTVLDYHMLMAYRKFSAKILGTEGHWEVLNEGTPRVEGDGLSAKDQLLRLYPTPKGAFPVTVLYIPVITAFRSAQARSLLYDYILAEAKTVLGAARRKISGMPSPDGGTLTYDGAELIQEGEEAKTKVLEQAIYHGEPMQIQMW